MNELIKILKENGRESLENIAKLMDTSVEDVATQISELENTGILRGYQAVINEDKLEDGNVTAIIEVKVTPEREGGFNEIANRIGKFPEVSSMYLMSGAYDLLLFVEGDNLHKVAAFVSEKLSPIPGVTGTGTHFKLKTYKHHGVVMEAEDEYGRLKISP